MEKLDIFVSMTMFLLQLSQFFKQSRSYDRDKKENKWGTRILFLLSAMACSWIFLFLLKYIILYTKTF